MNNGLLGFPGSKAKGSGGLMGHPETAVRVDQTGRSFSMDQPPHWDRLSAWIDPQTGCYTESSLNGSQVVVPATEIGSVRNQRYPTTYLDTVTPATRPMHYQMFQGQAAIYSGLNVSPSSGGMRSPGDIAFAEAYALVASPTASWGNNGGILTTQVNLGSLLGHVLDGGKTGFLSGYAPALCERNTVTTTNLTPINQWFLLRWRPRGGSRTGPLIIGTSGFASYPHQCQIYIGRALVYDAELTSSEAEQVEQWFQRQYPSLTLT
jgi:hypothetical protein